MVDSMVQPREFVLPTLMKAEEYDLRKSVESTNDALIVEAATEETPDNSSLCSDDTDDDLYILEGDDLEENKDDDDLSLGESFIRSGTMSGPIDVDLCELLDNGEQDDELNKRKRKVRFALNETTGKILQ